MQPEEGGLMFKGKISALLAFQVRYVGVTLGQNLTIKSAEFSLFLGLLGEDKFEHQYLARIEDWGPFEARCST